MFHRHRKDRSIALLGFCSCGKSSVGRALAERIGYAWVDLDQTIEYELRLEIMSLLRRHGTDVLRLAEQQVIRRLATSRTLLTTGSGTPCSLRSTYEDFAEAVRRAALDIHYDNFKNEVARVQGWGREGVYAKVWGVLRGLQKGG